MPTRDPKPRHTAAQRADAPPLVAAAGTSAYPRATPPAESATSRYPALREEQGRLLLPVRVVPRAGRESLTLEAGEFTIRLTAAPVDRAANEALIALIAKRLLLPRRAVTIARGLRARHKVLAVEGIDANQLWRRLAL